MPGAKSELHGGKIILVSTRMTNAEGQGQYMNRPSATPPQVPVHQLRIRLPPLRTRAW